jgi:AcrR family transcriptional regulator
MVDPGRTEVKRRYDASRRRERAAAARLRILGSARRLMLNGGYAATTVASIAGDAEVSPETVYRLFGGKPGLVREICELALRGVGPVPAEDRSDEVQARAASARDLINEWTAFLAEVSPLVSPVLLLVRTAAALDDEMAELRTELDDVRLSRMTHNAATLHRTGDLRPGMTTTDAAEVLWAATAPDWYELLVLSRGWTIEKYAAFVANSIAAALLQPE